MSSRKKWLEAARAIHWATARLVPDENSPHKFRSPPPTVNVWPPEVVKAVRFVFGGGDELPLHRDMMTRFHPTPECAARAARVCESLAYDGAAT
jgi:hypothetical protein